jgi:hypothetical protein
MHATSRAAPLRGWCVVVDRTTGRGSFGSTIRWVSNRLSRRYRYTRPFYDSAPVQRFHSTSLSFFGSVLARCYSRVLA